MIYYYYFHYVIRVTQRLTRVYGKKNVISNYTTALDQKTVLHIAPIGGLYPVLDGLGAEAPNRQVRRSSNSTNKADRHRERLLNYSFNFNWDG